jgi:hypothetical protein
VKEESRKTHGHDSTKLPTVPYRPFALQISFLETDLGLACCVAASWATQDRTKVHPANTDQQPSTELCTPCIQERGKHVPGRGRGPRAKRRHRLVGLPVNTYVRSWGLSSTRLCRKRERKGVSTFLQRELFEIRLVDGRVRETHTVIEG